MSDTVQTIWRSAARFFSGTMLSRVTGLLRDMAMAYAFGTHSAVAAFLVAFRLAHLFRRLLGEGAMQSALIPQFEELRKNAPLVAGRFFLDLGVSLSFVLILLVALLMGGIGGIVAYFPLSAGNREILWLTLLMLPSLLFICLFGIHASLLQCEKRYFTASAAPILFNLIWIMGVFCTSALPVPAAMQAMALFIIIACLGQWAATLPETMQVLRGLQVKNVWQHLRFFSPPVRQLAKPLALGIFGIAAAQINNALDVVFARWASEEGPAYLWYAIRLQQLPLALFGVALSGALLPPLARAVKSGQHAQYQQFLEAALKACVVFMLPITAFLFVSGESCVRLLFGHGDFSDWSVLETTHALWGYSLGLLPMTLTLALAPAFYAEHNYRTPSLAAAGSMLLNIGLNTFMVAGMGWGATSVAVATSISAWFNCVWLAAALRKRTEVLQVRLVTPSLVKCAIQTSVLSLAAALFSLGCFWLCSFESLLGEVLRIGGSGLLFGLFCLPLLYKIALYQNLVKN